MKAFIGYSNIQQNLTYLDNYYNEVSERLSKLWSNTELIKLIFTALFKYIRL